MIITGSTKLNTFTNVGELVVSFDGAQLTVYTQDRKEVSYVSMVSGYMMSHEQAKRRSKKG